LRQTTTTPGDPKHGKNQPDIHDNNNTQQQRHNHRGAEHGSICQESKNWFQMQTTSQVHLISTSCTQALYIGQHHFLRMVYARQSRALQAVLDATILLTTVLARFSIKGQIAGYQTPASNALAVRAYGIALFFWQHHLVFGALRIVEESIVDMTPEEENAPTFRRDWRYRRF
jgi:hypothetical protein